MDCFEVDIFSLDQ